MQIILNREFLTPAKTISKYQHKYILVGFLKDDVSKGATIIG